MIPGLMLSGAKAADCDGAITADEALKAEDARYAAQASSDFDAMGGCTATTSFLFTRRRSSTAKQVTSIASAPPCTIGQ